MINIGVTGWGDHDLLYPGGTSPRDKLEVYSGHFPVVEVDSSFYAIQSIKNYNKWAEVTPSSFSFVVKAFQGMTGHERGKLPYESKKEMFDLFKASIQPLQDAKKLKAVLFQYPPWFDCKKENVEVLRYTKEWMGDTPVALEFRNQTWFSPTMCTNTLDFMQKEGWIHTICDEPQAGVGSVPTVLQSTRADLCIVRLHGRNVHGWTNTGHANWREVRYLYRYNKKELLEWKDNLLKLKKESKEICVLFNNNSGGDAATNAKEMIELLGIDYDGLAPRQLELF
jgi:uncharacterized protein YecE (DUF72 family)